MNRKVGLSTELGIDGSWRMNLSAASRRGEYDISETIRDNSIGLCAEIACRRRGGFHFLDYSFEVSSGATLPSRKSDYSRSGEH
jgi:hypothetical protein